MTGHIKGGKGAIIRIARAGATHLAKSGVVGVEGESSLEHTAAALHMVNAIPQPDPFFQLRPRHPRLCEVRAELHAALKCVPRAHIVLQAAVVAVGWPEIASWLNSRKGWYTLSRLGCRKVYVLG